MLRKQELPVSSRCDPADSGTGAGPLAQRGRRCAGQEHPARHRAFGRRARTAAGHRRPTRASRSGRSTPRWTRCPSRRCPASGPSPAAATHSRREVRLEGRRGFPAPGAAVAAGRQRRGAGGAHRRASARWCCGSGTPACAGQLDRLLEGVFLELVPVILEAGRRLRRRRRRGAGAGGRAGAGPAGHACRSTSAPTR